MLKINRVLSRILLVSLLPLSASVAWAGNRNDAIVGGALGGVIGSIVGSQIGGRDGAVIGAGIGAMAGVAITTDGGHRRDRNERVRHVDERCRDEYRGGYRADYRGHHDRGYYADRGERDGHEDYRSHYYRD